jgi:hypothetical protein
VSALEYFNAELDGLRYRLARHNFIAGGFGSGGTATPRSTCACEEFDWERDCDKDFEMLSKINVGSRDATWELESFLDGPRIEFRAIYYVWMAELDKLHEINVFIIGKRRVFHGKWPQVNRIIAKWSKPQSGEIDYWPTKWVEEPKYDEPRDVTFSYDGNSVSTQIIPETVEMGDYLIPYSDPYCEGEKYKVWVHINSNMPNDGFFFEERKR